MPFHPDEVTRFRLTGFDVDAVRGAVRLGYAFDDGAVSFEERLDFGPLAVPCRPDPGPGWEDGFARVVRLLHLAAGVSYYKAAAPKTIAVETGPLSPVERALVHDLYDKGLREFAWHNGLPLERSITVEDGAGSAGPGGRPAGVVSPPASPPHGIGIPVGGGKDSAVVAEALRTEGPVLLSVGGHPAAHRVAAAAGLELAVVRRSLDPRLLELNRQGARNGHVPVTAIVSLIAVAAGFRLGYDTTVMALEGSADEPTRLGNAPGAAGGGRSVEVNHQWSKSSEFERALVTVLAEAVGPGVRYRSVLRDTDELTIAACFAALPQYHRAFVSCNRAFTLGGTADGWCGACPKCRFVYLALATAMDPADLVPVFGRDLLADPHQTAGFRDLFEEDRKPFECVGTRQESLVAVARLARRPPWAERPVVRALAPVAEAQLGPRADAAVPERAQDPQGLLEDIRRAVLARTAP